eukprot:s42_g4.t1
MACLLKRLVLGCLVLWDASAKIGDEIFWCLRAGSLCHGNRWSLKEVDHISHYLTDPAISLQHLRLADWDLDGHLDAVVLMKHDLWLYKITELGGTLSGIQLTSSGWNVNPSSSLEVGDWNGDGYPDVLVAEQLPSNRSTSPSESCEGEGKIRYFEQSRVGNRMMLQEKTGPENPFNVIPLSCMDQYSSLQLADWNGDGALDLFSYSHRSMKLRYFENQDGSGRILEATHRPNRGGGVMRFYVSNWG